MKKGTSYLKNILITVFILTLSFVISLPLQNIFQMDALVPAIFVLAVFLVSFLTDGYAYGLVSAFLSVLALNFAFTFPFFMFNFSIPENLLSAVIMIVVTISTGTLTTKIKRQEALKAESEKEKMRANLLRAVSHDLRTPLTTIYGSSSAIMENSEKFSPEQKQHMLQGIKEESEWLMRMVDNLLSVTKIDSGNVKILKTSTVLEELVDSVLLNFKKRSPSAAVELDIPEGFLAIPMDAILIEQVIVNLLENAVQHAEGMTTLRFRVFTARGQAIFEVQDDGCGIPEERLKNIFSGYHNKYLPADNSRHSMGIGLSVCATIIKAHGGDITAENLLPHGAVFRFSLNLEEAADEQ